MSEMRLSIVIPTLGGRMDYLAEAVRSACLGKESISNMEVIVLGNSGDAQRDSACAKLSESFGAKFVGNHAKLSIGANWNKGMRIAKGDYVSILHDDDLLSASFFDRFAEVLNMHQRPDFIYCQVNLIDGNGVLLREDADERYITDGRVDPDRLIGKLIYGCRIRCPGTVYRKQFFNELNGYDESYDFILDYELYLRTALSAKEIYCFLGSGVSYRIHESNLSKLAIAVRTKDHALLYSRLDEWRPKFALPSEYKEFHASMARQCFSLWRYCALNNQFESVKGIVPDFNDFPIKYMLLMKLLSCGILRDAAAFFYRKIG